MNPAPRAPLPRQGARPLPAHLALAATIWSSSRAAWPLWRNGSPPSNPALDAPARDLAEQLRAVDPDVFAEALDRELRGRADRFLTGLEQYRHHDYRRTLTDPPPVWTEGTTVLRRYGDPGGRPVLVVPSLVNRAYVLDLAEDNSLLRFLAGRGLAIYLVDWTAPGAVERRFDLTDYIAGRLEAALDALRAIDPRPAALVGYCMGGNLALALALRRQRDLARLVLLATPWDFHADKPGHARALAAWAAASAPWLDAWGEMPVDLLQLLFLSGDPTLGLRKFSAFADLDPATDRARAFVALEDWLNDGIPLAAAVARECLVDWYGANAPALGRWRVAGRAVDPAAVALPTLVMAPERDRIVPRASAVALADAIPGATLITPPLGHIGMVVGSGARAAAWEPLARWLNSA